MFRKTIAVLVLATAGATATAGIASAGTAPTAVHPVASPMEDLSAEQSFATQFGIASSVGGFGGTAVGAIIGCAIGGVVTAPTVVFVPAGCISGAVTGGAIGGIVGTIAVGGPTLIVSGTELIQALTAAPGTTKWAHS